MIILTFSGFVPGDKWGFSLLVNWYEGDDTDLWAGTSGIRFETLPKCISSGSNFHQRMFLLLSSSFFYLIISSAFLFRLLLYNLFCFPLPSSIL